jgi:hypothetical protein
MVSFIQCFAEKSGIRGIFTHAFWLLSSVTVTIITTLVLRVELDHRVDSHDGHTGLDSTLQLLDLAHGRFQNTHLQAVDNATLAEVQTVVFVVLLLGKRLLIFGGGLCGSCGVCITAATFRGREAL